MKFLVVGIDYFTKWVEAEPLATITEKNIWDLCGRRSYVDSESPGFSYLIMDDSLIVRQFSFQRILRRTRHT